jgi:hypothetical protein
MVRGVEAGVAQPALDQRDARCCYPHGTIASGQANADSRSLTDFPKMVPGKSRARPKFGLGAQEIT